MTYSQFSAVLVKDLEASLRDFVASVELQGLQAGQGGCDDVDALVVDFLAFAQVQHFKRPAVGNESPDAFQSELKRELSSESVRFTSASCQELVSSHPYPGVYKKLEFP